MNTVPYDPTNPENVLVIKLGALGDFIMAQGIFTAIRRHHPYGKITLLTIPQLQTMAEKSGLFDTIILDNRQKLNILKIPAMIKRNGYSHIYDLQGNSRTNTYYRTLRLGSLRKPKHWAGPARWATHPRPPHRKGTHRVQWWQDQMQDLGIAPPYTANWDWFQGDISSLNMPDKYALLVTGCSPHRPDKKWGAGNYIDMAKRLINTGITPVLIGAKDETEINEAIKKHCSLCVDLTNKTDLFQLSTLAQNACIAIGNDTGPMHVIAAVGCPTVTVFSQASDPTFIAPRNASTDDMTLNPYIQVDDLKTLNVTTVWEKTVPIIRNLNEETEREWGE